MAEIGRHSRTDQPNVTQALRTCRGMDLIVARRESVADHQT